ncbi:hypothetical protein NQZ68_020327 [Dissostichus eleginoides]|nr:hypothetical protein NQZ68_020327 [Dissostichus eleginoides]
MRLIIFQSDPHVLLAADIILVSRVGLVMSDYGEINIWSRCPLKGHKAERPLSKAKNGEDCQGICPDVGLLQLCTCSASWEIVLRDKQPNSAFPKTAPSSDPPLPLRDKTSLDHRSPVQSATQAPQSEQGLVLGPIFIAGK